MEVSKRTTFLVLWRIFTRRNPYLKSNNGRNIVAPQLECFSSFAEIIRNYFFLSFFFYIPYFLVFYHFTPVINFVQHSNATPFQILPFWENFKLIKSRLKLNIEPKLLSVFLFVNLSSLHSSSHYFVEITIFFFFILIFVIDYDCLTRNHLKVNHASQRHKTSNHKSQEELLKLLESGYVWFRDYRCHVILMDRIFTSERKRGHVRGDEKEKKTDLV